MANFCLIVYTFLPRSPSWELALRSTREGCQKICIFHDRMEECFKNLKVKVEKEYGVREMVRLVPKAREG